MIVRLAKSYAGAEAVRVQANASIGISEAAGIERLPDDCLSVAQPAALPPARDGVSLTGKRGGDALNALIAVDPRYAWIESDGVIVVRPVTAWADQHHFLHRTIPPFVVIEQHFGVAFAAWSQAVWQDNRTRGPFGPFLNEDASRPFTVRIARDTSAVRALDEIVRAHGRLVWEANFCQLAESGLATVVLRTTNEPHCCGPRHRVGRPDR